MLQEGNQMLTDRGFLSQSAFEINAFFHNWKTEGFRNGGNKIQECIIIQSCHRECCWQSPKVQGSVRKAELGAEFLVSPMC